MSTRYSSSCVPMKPAGPYQESCGSSANDDVTSHSKVPMALFLGAFSGAVSGYLFAGDISTSTSVFVSLVLGGWLGWQARGGIASAECPSATSKGLRMALASFNQSTDKPARVFDKTTATPLSFQTARLSSLRSDLAELFAGEGFAGHNPALVLEDEHDDPRLFVGGFGQVTIDDESGYFICSSETPCSATIIATAGKDQIIEYFAYEATRGCA